MGAPLLLLAALLQTSNPADLVPLPEMAAWGRCSGDQVARVDRPSLTPNQVAEAAMVACAAQERAVEAAQVRQYVRHRLSPVEARREVRAARERHRVAISSAVSEQRGLAPTADTVITRAQRYGQCLRAHIGPRLDGPESDEALIDGAFAACAEVQRWVLELAPPVPPAQLDQGLNAARAEIRVQYLREIAAARAAR